MDLVEKEDAYEITAELPGLDDKNVEIKLSNRTLTIRGEKSEEKEDKQKDYYLSERRYGSFQRSFQLPDGVDADKIDAKFTKGVLTVKLPKTAEAKKAEKSEGGEEKAAAPRKPAATGGGSVQAQPVQEKASRRGSTLGDLIKEKLGEQVENLPSSKKDG